MAILTGICIFQMAFISSGDTRFRLVLWLGLVGKLLQHQVTLEMVDQQPQPLLMFQVESFYHRWENCLLLIQTVIVFERFYYLPELLVPLLVGVQVVKTVQQLQAHFCHLQVFGEIQQGLFLLQIFIIIVLLRSVHRIFSQHLEEELATSLTTVMVLPLHET